MYTIFECFGQYLKRYTTGNPLIFTMFLPGHIVVAMSLILKATLRGHSASVWSVSWSSHGLLASCGADRQVHIWSKSTDSRWSLIATSPADAFLRTVRDVAWSADGRSLALASFDASATVLELTGGSKPTLEAAVCLEGHDAEVKSVAYSSSGGLLATCSRDRSVWIWEVGLDFDYECVAVLNSHRGDVKKVVWHPKVEMLLSCSFDQSIRVWVEDADDWFCSEELMAHSATVWDICFDDSGDSLASVAADGNVVIWRRELPPPSVIGGASRFVVAARAHALSSEPLYSVDWCPGRQLLAIGGGDDAIHLLKRLPSTEDDSANVESRDNCSGTDATSTKANRVISSSMTEEWSVQYSEKRAHNGDVNSVAWNPEDSTMLASCGDDGAVRIWQYTDKEPALPQ